MTRGAAPLTYEQKEIIKANISQFAEDIMKMPGMEGTSRRQIQDYQRRKGKRDEEILIDDLEKYIGEYGLPQEFATVMKYIRYLKGRM